MYTYFARSWAAVVLVFCTAFAAHAWDPVASPDSYSTAQNVTLNVSAPGVLANDTDADGQTLTAVRVSNPSHGTLTLNANGSFTYRPATNYTGSDSFTYKASDGARFSSVVTVSLTVTPPPITIVTPPTNQAVCPGGNVTFSVVASGTGLTYQWRFGANNLSGKTNSTLVLNNITSANAGTYSVVVSRTGSTSKTNSATLSVNTPVSATPLANAMRAIGGIVVFQTTPSGTGLFSYVWKKGNAVIAGQTSSSLMLTNLQVSNSGLYSVVVSGACGSVTNSATLTVDSCFPSVDVMLVLDRSGSMIGQPYNDARSAASNFVHNLHLGGTNLDQAGLVSYNSSTTLDRVLTNSMSSLEQGVASIPAAGGNTCISCALQSGQAELLTARHKTNALPVLVLLSDGLPTQGDTPNAALNTATQAQIAGTRIFTVGLGDVDHALMRGIASATNDYFYATNSSQLAALFDAISTVICRPPTNIFGPSSTVVCSGENVTLRVEASGCAAFTYQWRKEGALLAGQTNNTLVLNAVTPANSGLYAVEVRSTCRNQTNTATLTVNTPATIVAAPASQTSYVGSNATFNVGATGTALTYAWRRNGTLLGTNSSLTITELTTNNTGVYCVTVTSAACGSPVTNCATLTIQNRAPFAANDIYTTPEDTTLTIAAPGVLANDSDPDGNALSAVLASNPAHGTLTLNPNGSFTYTPAANYNGPDTFTYRASDGSLTSALATVTINVTTVNDPPVANDDNYSMAADTALTIAAPGVLVNDTDVENNPLSAVLASNPAHGTLTLNANGSFTYQPNTNYSGGDTFTYRASDGSATSGVATVSITIVAAPIVIVRPPTDSTNCPGDTASFTVTSSGTALTYQWRFGTMVLPNQTNSTLVLNDVTATNAGTYCVLVSGPAGGTLTSCGELVVNQNVIVTTPPTNLVVCQNSTAQFTVGATGTGLNYQWLFGAAVLTNQTSNTLTLLDVSLNAAGTYTVIVSGACAPSVTNNVTLTVRENLVVQTPPVPQTSFVGSNVTFTVGATGTGLTYQWFFNSVIVGTNNVLNLGNLTTNQAGTYCVVVRGACGSPMTNCTTLIIPNRAPVANNDSYTAVEDTALTIGAPGVLANDTDPDGDTLSALLVTNPAHGTVTLNSNGSFTYTPSLNYTGADTFTYRASDTQTSSLPATVTILVRPVNDAPVARDDAYTINEDTTLTISAPGVLANDSDVDGDTLTAVFVSNPAHGSLTLQTNGAFVYVPQANYNGTDSFAYRASDGALQSSVATVTITINPTNDAPVAVNDDFYRTSEDTILTVAPRGVLTNDLDVDGDLLTAVLVSTTTNGTLTLSTNGGFIYAPNTNFNGIDRFTYRATDGRATSGVAVVTITVTPGNDAPMARDDAYTVQEDTTLSVAAPGVLGNDSDVDFDPLTAVLVSGPSHGLLTLGSNGAITYIPNINYNGPDSFTYVASDGQATSSVATVRITVVPVNDPPVTGIASDNYTVLEDRTLTTAAPGVLANDSDLDGDALTAVLVSGSAHGTLALNASGSFVYRPATNYFGPDSFVYVANDGRTNSLPATVNITVVPVNDAPSFAGRGDQKINQNAPAQTVLNWAQNISAGPANESDQALNFTVSNDSNVLFSVQPGIAPNGTLTYTPALNAFGIANVRVVLRDNGGTANGGVDTSGELTFRIVVNGPPTVSIVSPTNGTVFLSPATFSIIADATDPDGTVTNVQFLANDISIGNVAAAPFYLVWSNVFAGDYALLAVATDNSGLSATSVVVNVTVITNAVVATGPIVLNRQNGLFEQFVTVSNRTTETWANGVRLWIYELDTTNTVWNATGTNGAVPYLDKVEAVPPSGTLTFLIQYYVPNPSRSVPNPTLVAVPLPFQTAVQIPHITRIDSVNRAECEVLFTTQSGRIYFIQSSEDLIHWTTDPRPMHGNGAVMTCPETQAGAKRFYRVLMVP